MDFGIPIALGVFITGIATFFVLSSAKYFTIREHQIYDNWVKRELDLIHKRLEILETTRPTTGELEARMDPTLKEIIQRRS